MASTSGGPRRSVDLVDKVALARVKGFIFHAWLREGSVRPNPIQKFQGISGLLAPSSLRGVSVGGCILSHDATIP